MSKRRRPPKRLQVLLDPEEDRGVQEMAAQQGTTVAELVRRTLREARRRTPRRQLEKKLDVIRRAAEHSFPAPDIDQMLLEIEKGYLAGDVP